MQFCRSKKRILIQLSLIVCLLCYYFSYGNGFCIDKEITNSLYTVYSIDNANIKCLSTNNIYINKYDKTNDIGTVECLSLVDNSKLWDFSSNDIFLLDRYQNPYSVDEDRFPILTWADSDMNLYVINPNGKIENDIVINPDGLDYPEVGCYVANGMIYYFQVGTRKTIGFDYLSNSIVWSFKDESPQGCCTFPILLDVTDNHYLLLTTSGKLQYIHNENLVWEYTGMKTKLRVSDFVPGNNRIIFGVKKNIAETPNLFYLRILDKNTGELIQDFGGWSSPPEFMIHNNYLCYATDNKVGHRGRTYDVTTTNTLHKMSIDTFEEEWSLQLDDLYFHIGIGDFSNQIVDNKLYLRCFRDKDIENIEDEEVERVEVSYKTIVCVDVESGDVLQTYQFENSIKKFAVTSEQLIIETVDDVTCYAFNKEDVPPKEEPSNEINLKFRVDNKSYFLDSEEKMMDVSPTIKNGRTLLPARYVTGPLGGQVFWDGEQRKVTCKLVAPDNAETEDYKENVVELWIGKSTAKLNGVEVQIDPDNPDVVPTIINDRTMVPMRFLAESLGCEVEWVAETKEIILTYTP